MSAEITHRVQDAYDRLAPAFAESNHREMPADLQRLAKAILSMCGSGASLLDVGCGTGRDMAWFEGRGLRAIGVDRSTTMLAFARETAIGNLVFMDARALGFADKSFDAVWCCASLLHLPRTEAPLALVGIRRIMKTGRPFMLSMQEGQGDAWESGYGTDIERYFVRYESAELEHMLATAGFSVVEKSRTLHPTRTWLAYLSVAQ